MKKLNVIIVSLLFFIVFTGSSAAQVKNGGEVVYKDKQVIVTIFASKVAVIKVLDFGANSFNTPRVNPIDAITKGLEELTKKYDVEVEKNIPLYGEYGGSGAGVTMGIIVSVKQK
ncbi:MAG: hypothetical protein HYW78_03985 [Parcubacteria group bacterium]|nr:hypothetical protein [Parcubacteria group bacterium]